MVKAEIYKGIEFVRISKLPEDEALQIAEWSRKRKITILTEEEIWRDCLQYKHYKDWYETHYQPEPNLEVSNPVEKRPEGKKVTFGVKRLFYALIYKD